MTRRRRQAPDTRPDWRDPAMPVHRDYRFSDGRVMTEVDPSFESEFRAYLLGICNMPPWYWDPTHNLRRKK